VPADAPLAAAGRQGHALEFHQQAAVVLGPAQLGPTAVRRKQAGGGLSNASHSD
jgi:hypothetical protein